tara:strand:+ start:61 stop:210 length:150 start_codon:yes stop_codon:yes gene_type:complete
MSNFISFLMGTCSGIYLAQNYKLPDIKVVSEKIIQYLQTLEKNDDSKKD